MLSETKNPDTKILRKIHTGIGMLGANEIWELTGQHDFFVKYNNQNFSVNFQCYTKTCSISLFFY